MDNNLSELEKQILQCREVQGLTIDQTIEQLKITRTVYQKSIKDIKQKGLYDEEKIKKAKNNKKRREYLLQNKNTPCLSKEEKEYRKKCIDIMCKKYFDYDSTHNFNPMLVKKLSELSKSASYKVIFNTIKYQEKSLDYANKKSMSSEYAKINYMMAIIKNNLNVVYKKIQRQQKEQEAVNNRTDFNGLVTQLNKTIVSKPTEKIDMSIFLEEDE